LIAKEPPKKLELATARRLKEILFPAGFFKTILHFWRPVEEPSSSTPEQTEPLTDVSSSSSSSSPSTNDPSSS